MSETDVLNVCFVKRELVKHPKTTEERVLAAATRLFAERGFHASTARDIAELAGANVASANYHFGSKEALYLEVLRRQFADIRGRIERQGSIPDAPGLERVPRARLEALLRRRVRTMAEFLIGANASPHGALMLREMLDPSDALPVIVAEFLRPQIEEVSRLLTRLAPWLGQAEIQSCVFSTMGQVLFYRQTQPAQLLLRGWKRYPKEFARRVADHATELTLGGLDRLQARARRGGRRAAPTA